MKGRVYRIICNVTGLQYIGATFTSLSKRLYEHKQPSNKCTSKIIVENGDYDILLLEEVEVDNKDQLKQRERHYIDTLECVNKATPFSVEELEEFRNNPSKSRKDLWRNWYAENKERLAETTTCECGAVISKRHLNEHLQREEHRYNMLFDEEKQKLEEQRQQQKKEYKAQWFQENRQKCLGKMKARREAQREAIKNDPELLAKEREYKKLKAREYREKKKLASPK